MSEHHLPSTSRLAKPQRILACVLCQQRKVKCDRKFPCANCTKARVQCVPATQLPRRRRRRFPERELLDRIRRYEDLLRKNNISFEPLHKEPGASDFPTTDAGYESEDHPETTDGLSPATTVRSERGLEVKNFWNAMRRGYGDDSDSSHSDFREVVVNKAWDQACPNDDHLIFGSRQTAVDLSTLHPSPMHIFQLWQLYLDNVNPLMRITHTPTLQPRIVAAASNMLGVSPVLEALLFGIYAAAVLSLTAPDCEAMLGSSKNELLIKYQFGCQQALLNCGFLRTSDRDCLTALYLYMISVIPSTDPRSLSSLLGLAVRIAQRMKLDSEAACAKAGVLEGEMRRRLWWALVLLDVRIAELAGFGTQTFGPAWDCAVPLNVNDADLRAEMKALPAAQAQPTEAIFAVVRAELGDYVRNTVVHLDFIAPVLKGIALRGGAAQGAETDVLERTMEEKYLRLCDPDDPLHYMTLWETRAYLAKCRLKECYWRTADAGPEDSEMHLESAVPHALCLLECDTKIMSSPLTMPFRWMASYYFPFPAYIHLLEHLKKRPQSDWGDQAWEVMSDNFDARCPTTFPEEGAFLAMFASFVLQAWAARETDVADADESLVAPRIVLKLREALSRRACGGQTAGLDRHAEESGAGSDNTAMPTLMEPGGHVTSGGPIPNLQYAMPSPFPSSIQLGQLDWTTMDWGFGQGAGW